jgi:ribosome-interacting GTPase 1
MKSINVAIQKPHNPNGYTVAEACSILNLSHAQVNNLFKEYRIPKIKNRYYATLEQLLEIIKRNNRTLKDYDLYEPTTS